MLAELLLMQPIFNLLFVGHFSLSLLSYENVKDKIAILVGVEEVTKNGS